MEVISIKQSKRDVEFIKKAVHSHEIDNEAIPIYDIKRVCDRLTHTLNKLAVVKLHSRPSRRL